MATASEAADAAEKSAYDTTALQAEFKRRCDEGLFSGVLLVRAVGRDVFEGVCGEADLVNHIPIERGTRFKIYSTSKLITALTVMRLVETGQLTLDAPVGRYLDDAPEAWSTVTLRQLLNHTSGVPDLTPDLVGSFHRDWTQAMTDTLAKVGSASSALLSTPGATFAYNNFGFECLALVVQRVTHEPFAAVVQREVFDRAGMRTASFQPVGVQLGHLVDQSEPGLALGYNGRPGALSQANNWAFVQMGAGAIRATADDFAALDEALSAGRILTARSLALMRSDLQTPPPGERQPTGKFGLGLVVDPSQPIPTEGHSGGTNGYTTDFERFPAQRAMMIALNNRGSGAVALRRHVTSMLAGQASPAASAGDDRRPPR